VLQVRNCGPIPAVSETQRMLPAESVPEDCMFRSEMKLILLPKGFYSSGTNVQKTRVTILFSNNVFKRQSCIQAAEIKESEFFFEFGDVLRES